VGKSHEEKRPGLILNRVRVGEIKPDGELTLMMDEQQMTVDFSQETLRSAQIFR
jgi:hypothetical protein